MIKLKVLNLMKNSEKFSNFQNYFKMKHRLCNIQTPNKTVFQQYFKILKIFTNFKN